MSELSKRYDRNIRLFGEEGQRKLRQTKVLIAGARGLGCVLAQNVALLGPAEIASLDDDELDGQAAIALSAPATMIRFPEAQRSGSPRA
jgi:tRNA A37 threonylcarbamoyladenosine dehydratase